MKSYDFIKVCFIFSDIYQEFTLQHEEYEREASDFRVRLAKIKLDNNFVLNGRSIIDTLPGKRKNSSRKKNIWAIVDNPNHGTVKINANGRFTYRPEVGYIGFDSFTYDITDKNNNLTTKTANLSIMCPPKLVELFGDLLGGFIMNVADYSDKDAMDLSVTWIKAYIAKEYERTNNEMELFSDIMDEIICDIDDGSIKTYRTEKFGLIDVDIKVLSKWCKAKNIERPAELLSFRETLINKNQTSVKQKTNSDFNSEKNTIDKRQKLLKTVIDELESLSKKMSIEFDRSYMDFSTIDLHEIFMSYGEHNKHLYPRKIWSLNYNDFNKKIWSGIKKEGVLFLKSGVSAERFPEGTLLLKENIESQK